MGTRTESYPLDAAVVMTTVVMIVDVVVMGAVDVGGRRGRRRGITIVEAAGVAPGDGRGAAIDTRDYRRRSVRRSARGRKKSARRSDRDGSWISSIAIRVRYLW